MFTPTMNWGDGCYSGGTWSTYEEPEMVYYLAGSGFPNASWDAGSHLALTNNEISFENLSAGTYKFKITNNTWDFSLDAGSVDASCSTPGAYSGDSNGNITVILAGEGSISISVADGKICLTVVGETDKPYSGSAVPSECGDVLLQGFYYDSYDVDPHHNGTAEYGDTKWKTLLAQSGEIGAYFDLIWLPPSGYASGVGYHPKQYSNQNSDWGSRTDLEKLIAAFHNSGTKVVADIVINHAEAMTGWCDMATEDFGEYGVFEPGPSFITSNDEVNNPANNVDTLAGDCWGYSAASRADDGANWDAARDWAHDNPEVQEMFNAYLKWMKNVMKYDGWRYDKGDGYSNWHMDNYNKASEPYIAFEEYYDGNAENIKNAIRAGNMNMMAFDFPAKFDAINPIAGWNYVGRRGLIGNDGTGSDYWKKHAVTWVENHDMFLRDDNDLEFGGRNNSMTPAMKYRVLDANAFILSMPGVPCVFYPHWYKYKDEIKAMINARYKTGVHSESAVSDEAGDGYYKATITGTNGEIRLLLGPNSGYNSTPSGYTLAVKGNGYGVYYKMNSARGDKNTERKDLTQGIEEVSSQPSAVRGEKVLRDGQLLIKVGEQVFDAFGRRVK
jgi:alpha-amylase